MKRLVEVPQQFDDRSFDQFAAAYAQARDGERLLFDAHASEWSSPFFFFQAEDGIRDLTVTGVQTCALPISAMKYFVLGAIASGALLYGMSLIYGLTGTLDLAEIAARLRAPNTAGVILGLTLDRKSVV